ncbi:MAG TPA: alpha/beta fold hydrolase [Magnetospirillum sp.]|nr:alpha/beta fold hydrolase [Magnetospirillum sp.]
MWKIALGKSELSPAKGDRRFSHPAWKECPIHSALAQAYLSWASTIERVSVAVGEDDRERLRARFAAQLVTGALSPSNSLLTNPQAKAKAVETAGASLMRAAARMAHDVVNNGGMPSQTEPDAFAVGKDLAATPGAVVLRTPMLELIEYAPQTEEVLGTPMLLVPPVVNKYYLLDLAPGRSMIENLVQSGVRVFAISWRNPTAAHRDWGLDAYAGAIVEALDAACRMSGSPSAHMAAICTGAAPASAALGHLAATGKGAKVASATMVVSVLDSNKGASLGLFANPDTIETAKRRSAAEGVLCGREMGRIFTWMRPDDLVWNYMASGWLMGEAPATMDLLHWNNDPIRVTAAMHADLLHFFSEDPMRRPGGLVALGTPVTLAQVECDSYFVAGATDHISLWQGVYDSARLLGGPSEFVLHSSGHVQAIVNPPGSRKSSYLTGAVGNRTPEEWKEKATAHEGSWWAHWTKWLELRSAPRVPAPAAPADALAAAPGTYVFEA